jgi:hypothetical protein
MSRCGCGDQCNCVVQGGTGIGVGGSGNANNPYTLAFDGSRVAGNGIGWDSAGGHLSARLATGGGLAFDGTGALETTSSSSSGGGGATVAALEAMTGDVIGGSLGSGFMIKPPDLLRSYQNGLQGGLDFMHVPVRFLSNGSPVVTSSETMQFQDGYTPRTDHVQDQDGHRWKTLNLRPGAFLTPTVPGTQDPRSGYFGYLEQGQGGNTFLSDVFRECGGKTVLLLQLQFPSVDGSGNFVHTTPTWRTELFLQRVLSLINAFNLAGSVIISTDQLTIPPNGGTIPTDVLARFSNAGIRVGPWLATTTDTTAHPADSTWPATWTWVFLNWTLGASVLQPYVNKGLKTILWVVSRQYLRNTLVNKAIQSPGETPAATGVGALGVISADPLYYAGFSHNPKFGTGGGIYIKTANTWRFSTVDHGLLPAGYESLTNMITTARGQHCVGYQHMIMGPNNLPEANSKTAWTLQGWMCPLQSPTSWAMDVGVGYNQLSVSGTPIYGWMAVAFCVPTDHGFKDTDPSAPPAVGDPRYTNDSGYIWLVDSNGYSYLWGFQAGVGTTMGPMVLPYEVPKPINSGAGTDSVKGASYWFRIGVNANGIRVSTVSGPNGTPNTVIHEQKTTLAKANRGPYVYFGYASGSVHGWEGFHDNAMVVGSGAFPNGPNP